MDLRPYVEPTPLIDCQHPEIQKVATDVTAGKLLDRDKAIALHDYVRDTVKFGFSKSFWKQKASETLREGRGFCNTKGQLFVALLRASRIPARLHYVDIQGSILRGFASPGAFVDHTYTEVFLDNKWVRTDSYVVDRALFLKAQAKLKQETEVQAQGGGEEKGSDSKVDIGYGTLVGATIDWNGQTDAYSQLLHQKEDPLKPLDGLSTANHGTQFRDMADFYRRAKGTQNGGLMARIAFRFFGAADQCQTNAAIEQLRKS